MPTTDYQPPRGTAAIFAGDWLRHPGRDRYLEGYRGILVGWWNGEPEFTIDATAAVALVATFDAMATYVAGSWRTVAFDGRVLTVARPHSLGGGVHQIPPVGGRYRVGWGLSWHLVDVTCCDRVVGGA